MSAAPPRSSSPASSVARVALVTRPEPDASALALRLAEMGWGAVLSPALRLARLDRASPGDWRAVDAALFTSPRGAELAAADLACSTDAVAGLDARAAEIPAYAVGDRTAETLRAAGFRQVRSAGRDAAALLALVRRSEPAGARLLLYRGRDMASDVAGALRAAGFPMTERALYAMEPVALSTAAAAAFAADRVDAALFFSARTAEIFAREAPPAGRAAAVCNSERTARALPEGLFSRVGVADEPSLESTLARLTSMFS